MAAVPPVVDRGQHGAPEEKLLLGGPVSGVPGSGQARVSVFPLPNRAVSLSRSAVADCWVSSSTRPPLAPFSAFRSTLGGSVIRTSPSAVSSANIPSGIAFSLLIDEAEAVGRRCGLTSPGHSQLSQQIGNMHRHSAIADVQPIGNLLIAATVHQFTQDVVFT